MLRKRYGEWALVTGASSGIGRALAHELAAGGMSVAVLSEEPGPLEEARAEIAAQHGVEAEALHVDLSSPDAAERIEQALGPRDLGVVVNCASFGRLGPFGSVDLETYRRMLAVNVDAYLAITHTFLPALLARGRGALVFVSSLNALAPGIGGSAVYTASKAFELSLACGLWQETLGSGVDVQLVLPGPTRTGFQKEAGTRVASWAMEPQDVARGAVAGLGQRLLHIAGEPNELLAARLERLALERRVTFASRLIDEALLKGSL